ncbi:hypothetical protein DV515_00019004, partial [Chloebia gouldiae]
MGLTVALDDNLLAEGQLYWDDGVRINAYEDGVYLLTSFTAKQNYSDPNNLVFTDIRVLGLPRGVSRVTVAQNGTIIPSRHNVTCTNE